MKFPIETYHLGFEALPLPRLMTKLGDGAFGKKGAKCPFCGSDSWKVFPKGSRHFFKCHQPGCVANDVSPEIGHHEIGYLVLRKNLSLEEAKEEFIKLAVPQEYERLKAEAEKRRKKSGSPAAPKTPSLDAAPEGSSPQVAAEPPPPPPENVVPFAPGPPPSEPPNVFDAINRKLILTPRDQTKLKQRGFSEETIAKLGFKSNNQSNRILIESLKADYPMDLLIETGIFKSYRSGLAPNRQLLGWGLRRRANKAGEPDTWDWTEPILIPYLDANGVCFHLRPHKGEISPYTDADRTLTEEYEDDDEPRCHSHVYCPFLLAASSATIEGTAILTEGEFKAAAVFQCGIPVIAIPGTSFVRNLAFRAELLGIIKQFGITDLVIVFDNEVKDDPNFPSRYKPDPADRYDTQMWAEYIAWDLTREHFGPQKGHVRLAMLPDNLREDGKADFDSALSYFVRQQRDPLRGTDAGRKVFQKIVEDARPPRRGRDLFPSESRRIIEHKLARLFYKPNVPFGGDKELHFANQCQAAGEVEVAKAYRAIVGCYWNREPLPTKEERELAKATAVACSRDVEAARAAGINGSELRALRTKERAAWEIAKGLPAPISDFIMSCEFKLFSSEGKATYLVKIRNHSDAKWDSKLYPFSSDELGRGPEFCCSILGTGKGVWKGGARNLTELQEDLAHQAYMRDIYQVNYYGYHADSGLWFFGDCAFGPNGDLIEADKYNVFWHAGVGYQIDPTVSERGTTFEQGAPLMLSPHGAPRQQFDIGDLFGGLCVDMFSTIGGYDAWLMLGLVFAYAAAPELLKLGGHPAPWLYGKMSGGKTTLSRWLMRIWGFKDLGGIRINKGTTHVGMNRTLAQYSCLPVWFDEYRSHEMDSDKEGVLRGAFDRNSAAKGLADHSNRTRSAKMFTTPIVSGEGSSSDAATRSRYAHINVSDRRRIGDGAERYARVQQECKHYYLLGRFVMENRPKFVKKMMETHEKWMMDKKIRSRIANERVRFVYATAWSAFSTLSRLFTGNFAEDRIAREEAFHEILLQHGEQALHDVQSETFLSRFWNDLLSALARGKVKKHFFDIRYVIKQEDGSLQELTETKDKELAFPVCYICPKAVFDEYAQDLRSRNESPPLDLGDLRREMSKEPYWIPPPTRAPFVHRIRINGSQQACWVISLERKEDGTFICPFGEDLEQQIEPGATDEDSDKDLDAVNTELAGQKDD